MDHQQHLTEVAASVINAQALLSEAQRDRSRAIREALATGMTLAQIGRALGVSRQRVHQLLR